MNDKLTNEEKQDLIYFWEETGDLERYCHFEKLLPKINNEFPELLNAWYSYKNSITLLDTMIEKLNN